MKIVRPSAVVFAATSILGASCSQTQRSGPTAPWQEPGRSDDSDPRRRALSYAVPAPNPHNRHPWQVDLDRANEIVLSCDPDRLLAETDPFERQILIGLGCFLEVLRMAAAQDGMLTAVERFPDGVSANHLDARPIARTNLESVRLMRIGRREIEANPDGIDLGGPVMGMLSFLGIATREELADPTSTAFKQGLERVDEILNSAMAYLWITTDGNSRFDPLDASIHARLADSGKRIQMFARLGYGPTTDPSPRWPVETRIVHR